MEKFGILSKHIIICDHSYPVYGIIIIKGEYIQDIILLEDGMSVQDAITKFSYLHILDYSEYYISPGIIDLNARKEWESYATLTKSAVSGGITFILEEPSFYGNIQETSDLFCDIGKVLLIDNQIPGTPDDEFLAYKAYLFQPTRTIKAVTDIKQMIDLCDSRKIPLFIDPNLPDPRMMHINSPLRLESIEDHLDKEVECDLKVFAAAFPEKQAESDETESEEITLEQLRTVSLLDGEIDSFKSDIDFTVSEFDFNRLSKGIDEELKDQKEKLQISPMKKHKPNVKSHTIYDDLDHRIKVNKKNIEQLVIAESSTYQNSGNTSFKAAVPEKKTTERRRPPCLETKSIVKIEKVTDYNFYLANCPESWETNGISLILSNITPSIKIHFQNISSALSINIIRQASESNKNISSEIGVPHLFFNSNSIGKNDIRFKSSPPIRNASNFNLLWDLLKMRGVNCISSQHVLIDYQHKAIETKSFQHALNGICSMGASLQSVWTTINIPIAEIEQLEHYLVRLSKWMSLYPSKIIGLKDRGNIDKNKTADLIIWSPYCRERLRLCEEYQKLSPFHMIQAYGSIHKVYLRGKIAYDMGQYYQHGKRVTRSL